MRQERLSAAGRRPRAGVKQRQQGSGGVGNIISNVLKKRNGISRSAPRLLCTLEPGDPPAHACPDQTHVFRSMGKSTALHWSSCGFKQHFNVWTACYSGQYGELHFAHPVAAASCSYANCALYTLFSFLFDAWTWLLIFPESLILCCTFMYIKLPINCHS